MATVFLAEHPRINKKVAIKVINQDLASSAEMVSRFMTEARAASQIGHDHIVDILDFGQSPEGENFMIMEYLEGQTISSRIRGAGHLDVLSALHITMQIVDALQNAHAKGVIHRDLKPDNIYLIRRAGTVDYVKILDFGLAKLLTGSEGQNHKTSSGSVLGTPHYMAPEQCEGKLTIDGRADLYSVGCIVYQMLTGELPFPGEGFAEVLIKHLSEPPPLIRARNPLVPPSVEKLVLHCLAKSRDHRFQSADELLWALRDPETWSAQFGDDMMRIVGPLPGRGMPMLPPQMPTMLATGHPQDGPGAMKPLSPIATVSLPPPSSPAASLARPGMPAGAATIAVGSSQGVVPLAPTPGQSAVRMGSSPPALPNSSLDIPVLAANSPQLAEVPADASRAAPQMATLIGDLSSASLSSLMRQNQAAAQPVATESSQTPVTGQTPPQQQQPQDELSTIDGSAVAGLSTPAHPAGSGSQPGPGFGAPSGLHPAALPPPQPLSSPPPTNLLEKLKALPPVQRFLALPEQKRTLILGIGGGTIALLFLILAVIIILPSSVTIQLSTKPADVEVVRDGKPLGKTPFALKLEKHEKARLVFRKEGFTEAARTVSATEDTQITIELAEESTESPENPTEGPSKPGTPTKTDPGKTDPAKTDPGKTDPAKTDPGKTDPGKQPKVQHKVIRKGPKKPKLF